MSFWDVFGLFGTVVVLLVLSELLRPFLAKHRRRVAEWEARQYRQRAWDATTVEEQDHYLRLEKDALDRGGRP